MHVDSLEKITPVAFSADLSEAESNSSIIIQSDYIDMQCQTQVNEDY